MTFYKGKSGNPYGRPTLKLPKTLDNIEAESRYDDSPEACSGPINGKQRRISAIKNRNRRLDNKALKALEKLVEKGTTDKIRLDAANAILDRTRGKPATISESTVTHRPYFVLPDARDVEVLDASSLPPIDVAPDDSGSKPGD